MPVFVASRVQSVVSHLTNEDKVTERDTTRTALFKVKSTSAVPNVPPTCENG